MGPSWATFGRLGGRFYEPKRRTQKSNPKRRTFSVFGPFFSSGKVIPLLVLISLFSTRVFDCDMWGHSRSIVRAIELELFVVLFFLIFCIANVSNYSKCRPNFVHSLSPLGSLFFVSKSSQNVPKSESGGSRKSEKSRQSLVGEVFKSFWSFWSRRWSVWVVQGVCAHFPVGSRVPNS